MPRLSVTAAIAAAPDVVWSALEDVPSVVGCVPGMELVEVRPDGSFVGRMGVRLGPVRANFAGEASFRERDVAQRRAVIEGKGVDKAGGSRASALLTYVVGAAEAGPGSTIAMDVDYTLTGALAQMGRTGILQDVATALTQEFARNLEAKLAADVPAAPADDAAEAPAGSLAPAAARPAPAAAKPLGLGGLILIVLKGWWRRLVG